MFKKIFGNLKKFRLLIYILIALMGVGGLLGYVRKVNAANVNAGPLNVAFTGVGAMFTQSDMAPGDVVDKEVTVTNNGTVNHSFAIATKNVTGELKDALYIKPVVNGSEVWSKSVSELANLPTESQTVINDIAPGNVAVVNLKAEFDPASGNDYQGKSVNFNFVFGTQEAEPTPTPSVTGGGVSAAGTTGTGLLARFRGTRVATVGGASATASATETASVTATAGANVTTQGGEVKGAQTEAGENWILWVIAPLISLITMYLLAQSLPVAIGVPVVSAALVLILSSFTSGRIPLKIFWLVLALEIILLLVLHILASRSPGKKKPRPNSKK